MIPNVTFSRSTMFADIVADDNQDLCEDLNDNDVMEIQGTGHWFLHVALVIFWCSFGLIRILW